MSAKLILPYYLTKEICHTAVSIALRAVMEEGSLLRDKLKRHCCHIVVLVPSMRDEGQGLSYYPIHPALLYELSIGNTDWTTDYTRIARNKALQLWHERNDERATIQPHLLFPGETKYSGGVKRHGIVVACSGVQPHYDQLISGISADTIKALCLDAHKLSGNESEDFLPE